MRRHPAVLLSILMFASATTLAAQSGVKRPLRATDMYALRGVTDPQLSPDGA